MRRDVFQAIADPTRRAIISLVTHQSLNLNSLSENFKVSRPAISKHIKILTECGLVVIRRHGRESFCEAKLGQLNEVSDWVEKYKKFWNTKLDSLEDYLTTLSKESPTTIPKIKKENKLKPKKNDKRKTK